MPLVFTKEEIREYLNEMGYPELEGEELDRFVKDLKRLIKFESKQRRRRRLGHTGHTHSDLSSIVSSDSPSYTTLTTSTTTTSSSSRFEVHASPESDTSLREKQMQPFLRQPKTSRTRASTADEYTTSASDYNPPKSKVLTVKQTRMSTLDEYSTSTSEDINHNRIEGTKQSRPVTAPATTTETKLGVVQGHQKSSQAKVSSSSATSSLETNTENLSEQELLNLMEYVLRNEIQNAKLEEDQEKKVCLPPPSIGRDPVALYHWYKAYWDRQKAPGEDRHMQLRWNVRAGTVGKVPCDPNGNPVEYLKRANPVTKPRSCWVSS